MSEIGVFDNVARSMERLGFLKRVLKRASMTATSHLENLGNDLINTASQKVKIKINEDIYRYARSRIRANFIKPVQKEVDDWLNNLGPAPEINIELQDLYLSHPQMPSCVGRLVKDNWRRYPALGTNLGLLRKGTYSLNTRGISFLHLVPEEEIKAFDKYTPDQNPLLIGQKLSLLLIYSCFENDGEVIAPLWQTISSKIGTDFSEKQAGQFLSEIYRSISNRYQKKLLSLDIRERLQLLETTARNIERIPESGYGGTSPLDTAVRPRIEPYVDLGIFCKKDTSSHEYNITDFGKCIIQSLESIVDNKDVTSFLIHKFFFVFANALEIKNLNILEPKEIVGKLKQAANSISSSSGYAPIEELALLAGIESLIDDHKYFEIATAREALIAYQKANPYQVRFTVDRMGVLAHAKFVDDGPKK